jgi:hypothetical protein
MSEHGSFAGRGKGRAGLLLVAVMPSVFAILTVILLLALGGTGLSLSLLALIVTVAAVGPFGMRSQIPFVWWVIAAIATILVAFFIYIMWLASLETGD